MRHRNKQEDGNGKIGEMLGAGFAAIGIWKIFESLDNYSNSAKQKQKNEQANYFYEMGEECEGQNNEEEALKNYFECLKLFPNDVQALNSIASIYVSHGIELDKAEEFIHRALVFSTNNIEKIRCLDNLAELYYEEDLFEKSNRKYFEIINVGGYEDCALPEIYYNIAHNYLELGDWSNSFKYFLAAHKLDIENPYYVLELAYVSLRKCDYKKAIDLSKHTVEIANLEESCHREMILNRSYNYMGEALFMQNLIHESISCFEKAITYSNPAKDKIAPWINLTNIYSKWGEATLVKNYIKKVVEMILSDVDSYRFRVEEMLNNENHYSNKTCKEIILNELLNSRLISKKEYRLRTNFGSIPINKKVVVEIRSLISKGETNKAIDYFLEKSSTTNKRINDNLLLISGRFHVINKKSSLGLITNELLMTESSKINNDLIDLLDTLDNKP